MTEIDDSQIDDKQLKLCVGATHKGAHSYEIEHTATRNFEVGIQQQHQANECLPDSKQTKSVIFFF